MTRNLLVRYSNPTHCRAACQACAEMWSCNDDSCHGAPARKGCSGISRAAQLVQTRCGVPSWNLGGSSMRPALQDTQKMPPHRRQWCRVRRSDLRT